MGMCLGIGVVKRSVACLDRQFAGVVHRIACIDCQIQDGVFQLDRINKTIPQPTGNDRLNLNRLSQGSPQHVIHASQKAADILWFWFKGLLAAESKQLRGQFCSPRYASHCVFGKFSLGVGAR